MATPSRRVSSVDRGYYPLASGLLTGKFRRGEPAPEGTRLAEVNWADRFVTDRNRAIVERLEAWAGEHGRSLLEIASAGCSPGPRSPA